MISERVRHARTYYGWSQSQLAQMAGVTQPAISQIEKTGQVSDETLDAIARATQFAPWFFRLGPLPDLAEGSLRFRKRASSTKRDDEIVRAHVRQAVEALTRSGHHVKLPPVRLQPLSPGTVVDDELVETLTADTREWLGVGPADPIPSMIRAAERAGVLVIGSAKEIARHDAASYWPDVPSGRPIVCYSRGFPGDRQRLSVAHEIGHLILHQYGRPEPKRAETEAFRYGASLLLPRDAALDEIETPVTLRGLAYVKARWGISVRALIGRCFDLRIISVERRVSLEKQLGARGWSRHEPVNVAEESPVLVRRLLDATIGPEASAQRISVALGLPPMAIRDLVA